MNNIHKITKDLSGGPHDTTGDINVEITANITKKIVKACVILAFFLLMKTHNDITNKLGNIVYLSCASYFDGLTIVKITINPNTNTIMF